MKKDVKIGLLFLLITILILSGLILMIYFVYFNLPLNPEKLNVDLGKQLEVINLSQAVPQFYSNMKFNHNTITYKIENSCEKERVERMLNAFDELSSRVSYIEFKSVSENPDIEVTCSNVKINGDDDYFIAGEGGAKEIIDTGRYYVINQGLILLYGNKDAIRCDWPNVELHELLHVFGFDHSKNKESLMYPYLESCDQKLDESIISDLKKLYSQENLPDLYFENVYALKKGKYLDFNITIKNSGVIDAKGVFLVLYDEGEKVHEFELNDVPFGAGVLFSVNNAKLNNRDPENIQLIIDDENKIKEIDENNNIAILKL